MATNNFKAFGIGSGANVTSQADYEALAALLTGFQSGKASSAQINKALRQSSTMAYVLAQFIADSASVDVLDNGTPATILANLKSSMTALTPGRLLNVQVFTTSGTYTPTNGAKKIVVEVLGAGGGGGSSSAANTSANGLGTGGGGGGYAKSYLTSVPASQSVTVGVGGAAASNGGASSFGSIIANGGTAGANNLNATYQSGVTQLRGGFGGTASGGNIINARGGMSIQALWTSAGNCISGAGGSSHFAGTTVAIGGAAAAGDSGTLGNGGSGANSIGTTSVLAGGSGGNGIVIVWEYA